MRTSNPALNENAFKVVSTGTEIMTIDGTVNKSFVLLAIVSIGAYLAWGSLGLSLMIPAAIFGFITALVTIFKKDLSPITEPIYALCEGDTLGGISAMFEAQYPGIVFNAITLTFGTFGALLIAYRSRAIKVTDNFRLGIVAATGGIALVYLISFIMSFFGAGIPLIHSSSTFGIGFSLFVVVIAALNLVLDFDFIEQAASRGVPKYMEWYASFGLLVTLVWLYLEILRLLAKLNSRD